VQPHNIARTKPPNLLFSFICALYPTRPSTRVKKKDPETTEKPRRFQLRIVWNDKHFRQIAFFSAFPSTFLLDCANVPA
jgi:hypothetical protein